MGVSTLYHISGMVWRYRKVDIEYASRVCVCLIKKPILTQFISAHAMYLIAIGAH